MFLVLLALVVVLLNLPTATGDRLKGSVRDSLYPFHDGMTASGSVVERVSSLLSLAWSRPDRERALSREVAELRETLWHVRTVEQENRELRGLMGFARRQSFRLVPCEVIAHGDSSGWWETLRLNRGSEAGIAPGMAVMSEQGLLGRTTAVSRETTEVLLITDPISRVSCRLDPAGVLGVLRGGGVSKRGRPELVMMAPVNAGQLEFLPAEAAIGAGMRVVTSGLGGIYPEGLDVGRVSTVEMDVSGLFQTAEMVPSAKFRKVRYAFVIMRRGVGE